MCIDFRKNQRCPKPVYIKGEAVERVDTYQYLCVVFDSKLSWKEKINSVLKKVNLRMYCRRKLRSFGVNSALKLLPLDKRLLLNKCVVMQKVVHGKAPQYLKDIMIPSERLHVHGNKQLLSRTRIGIFKTSFSFPGSLAWNSLAHHLRYPMELKAFKRKPFQALAKTP